MTEETAVLLFAAISIDGSLSRKRKRRRRNQRPSSDSDDNSDSGRDEQSTVVIRAVPIVRSRAELENVAHANNNNDDNNNNYSNNDDNNTNPAAKVATVSAQTYQNYKSALKWWHKYDSPECGKVGYPWPGDVDDAINIQIASYKRDVGLKKRAGYMKQKEGKSPYNLIGYVELSKFFMKMRPINNKYTWMEGIFASLFTKLSVNTIGRSDNIDDLLLSHIDWENDALTIKFMTTKPDQAGEKTCEVKRIYANPFKPEICPIFSLAMYVFCKRRSKKYNLF
jgi:hypothetical protein